MKLYPNADAPATPAPGQVKQRHMQTAGPKAGIPWFLLTSLAEAVTDEYRRQRSSISAQLDREVDSLETQLRSARDRREKKRLADALKTALHADEHLEAEIAKRLYAKLAAADHPYSRFVNFIDWAGVSPSFNGSERRDKQWMYRFEKCSVCILSEAIQGQHRVSCAAGSGAASSPILVSPFQCTTPRWKRYAPASFAR